MSDVPDAPAAVTLAVAAQEDAGARADRVVVFDKASPYARVFVVDEDGLRWLRFDDVLGNDQSGIDLAHPDRVQFEYVRIAGLASALAWPRSALPTPTSTSTTALSSTIAPRALVIGLGGGAFPRLLLQQHKAVVVDAVDIDPVVVDAARRFFALPNDKRLVVHVKDGAAFVASARAGYDVVLLDAFSGNSIPDALASVGFFADVRRVLADRGVVVLNLALVSPEQMDLITARFAAVFAGCVVVRGKTEENRVLFGGRGAVDVDALRTAALTSPAFLPYDAHKDVDTITRCR